nr:RHS repeat-associated core domain-containing protein [Burkholderia multivorans]
MLWTTLTHLSNELTRSLTWPLVRRRFKQADRASGAASDERGYGLTLYGWDGDTLAYETAWERRETTHYVYEPNSFTPLAQASGPAMVFDGGDRRGFATVAYYHCDQIGTPQEVTDSAGEIAWSARYWAWGAAKEAISDAACKAGIANPLRFAGQYFDSETGLHYNRHRYYDPGSGRFISKDPIDLQGASHIDKATGTDIPTPRREELARLADRVRAARSRTIRPSSLHAASAVRAASIHVASTIAAAFPGVDPSSCGA